MRILVTGAGGFIGSNLAEELQRQGHEVVGFSLHKDKNVFTGEIIQGNLVNKNDLDNVGPVDAIYHIAARSSPTDFSKELLETNIFGTYNVLQLAKKNNAKVVIASSSSVYGTPKNKIPMSEGMELNPQNNYAMSKVIGEKICKAMSSEIDVVCVRYFNTYGLGENLKGSSASMISQFIWRAAKKEPVIVYGDGSQARDFIFVKDVVGITIAAMEKKVQSGEVFNAGSGKATSFNEILVLIKEFCPTKIEIKYVPNPIKYGYQTFTQADLTKVRKVLKYENKYDVRKGIEELSKIYFKN